MVLCLMRDECNAVSTPSDYSDFTKHKRVNTINISTHKLFGTKMIWNYFRKISPL